MMADGELFVRADSPLIQFSGRSIIDASGARSFDFPGALISARIVGYGSITAILNESGTNRYAASLDGGKGTHAEPAADRRGRSLSNRRRPGSMERASECA